MRSPAVLQSLQQPQEAAHLPPVRGGGTGGPGAWQLGPPRLGQGAADPTEPEAWGAGWTGTPGSLPRCLGGRVACGPGTGAVKGPGPRAASASLGARECGREMRAERWARSLAPTCRGRPRAGLMRAQVYPGGTSAALGTLRSRLGDGTPHVPGASCRSQAQPRTP